MRAEWLEYIETAADLGDTGRRLIFYNAITGYYLDGSAPDAGTMNPEDYGYFNREIRPELDKQRRNQ